MLIEAGASIGKQSAGDETILEASSNTGTWDYALYLLKQNGADYTVDSEKNERNPEGLPEIVRSLENSNYWDYSGETSRVLFTNKTNPVLTRIESYNLTENLSTEDFSAEAVGNICEALYQNRNEFYRVSEFKDVNLYPDISPENYSIEGSTISGLAVINLKRYFKDNETLMIETEFFGQETNLFSNYIFSNEDHQPLNCVRQTTLSPSATTLQTDGNHQNLPSNLYVFNNNLCFVKEKNQNFKSVALSKCETFQQDARTYKNLVEG